MKNLYLRKVLSATALCMALTASAQENVPVKTGAYTPDWEGTAAWECPEWFRDAKFGMWAHWGPQCEAEGGDWYAHHMYYPGGVQDYHWNRYGDPAVFGFKDVCNEWKAENWDPQAMIDLYYSVGARYFMTLGQHHDNFDLWDTDYQEWNSTKIGPMRDIVGEWQKACEKYDLPFGVSMHGSHAWLWYEVGRDDDCMITKEEGAGKWWDGFDPQELYEQNVEGHGSDNLSYDYTNGGIIHSQWVWANGASKPTKRYTTKFQNRILECVNKYSPDMVYFDDTVLPFWGYDDSIGLNFLSHYYNHSAEQNGGEQQVVVMGKVLQTEHKESMLWDVERGIPDRPQDKPWQTCTCIGGWHYSYSDYQAGAYKSAEHVISMLIDIVSKNGNMLLSVPVRGDGTLDEKELAILDGIKAWMDINSTSIYGTRPWKNFGEGPLAEAANPLTGQGFNEGNNYSVNDVRFVERNDTVFATIMRWPAAGYYTFESFAKTSKYYSGDVKKVTLLGYGEVNFYEDIDGVAVEIPVDAKGTIAPVFAVEFDESTAGTVTLSDVLPLYDAKIEKLRPLISYNTGKWDKKAFNEFVLAVETAREKVGAGDAEEQRAMRTLLEAYETLKENGQNQGTEPDLAVGEDKTAEVLIESTNFSTTTMGGRFGTPKNWTVENFYIPQTDTSKGVKNGIDNYDGKCLSLGVWAGEDGAYDSDVANARIYRKVKLAPGKYYFGAGYTANYQLSQAYIFASTSLLNTEDIPEQALAHEDISKAGLDNVVRGIWFTIEEEQEVYIGWQANLKSGSGTQEFRAKQVVFRSYGLTDITALDELRTAVAGILATVVAGNNTGFYSRAAMLQLQAALDEAQKVDGSASAEEVLEAYNALNASYKEFTTNGIVPGGVAKTTGAYDMSVETFREVERFSRLDASVTTRFAAPRDWTVENFKIPNGGDGTKAGLDKYPGYDCLSLGVWNDAGSNQEGDLKDARIYRTFRLNPGRYYFGANYEACYNINDKGYIFAASETMPTEDIPTKSIAWYNINKSGTGTTHGIYFTLEEAQEVILGFQINLKEGSSEQEIRVRSVTLLYYGEVSYEKLQDLITDIETGLEGMKINNNTGYYIQEKCDALMEQVNAAKQVKETDDFDTINDAFQALSDTYADFLENGRRLPEQPDDIDAYDITIDVLKESKEFERADKSIKDRFASPLHWMVDNYGVQSSSEGIRGGLDKYPGYDCLTLNVWDDKQNTTSDLTDARIYQEVTLDAGTYYFGAKLEALYNIHKGYIFASENILGTYDIETEATAWADMNKCSNDGKFWGIYFTLEEETTLYLGFQADLKGGAAQQEFRAAEISLLRYGGPLTGIEGITEKVSSWDENAPARFYSITGVELGKAPANGLFIVRQGNKSWKVFIP